MPASIGSRLRITRSGNSLRMQRRSAVEAVTGSSPSDPRRRRIDGAKRIARKAHDGKADHRVPETDHGPGQCHRKEQKKEKIEKPEAAGRERLDRHPEERGHRNNDKRAIDGAALE